MSANRNQRARKIRALIKRPGSEGERLAAAAALARMVPAAGPQRLTEALIRKLPTPTAGAKIYYDQPDEQGNSCTRGFGVRVTANGVKAFVLNYRAKSGREGRVTIGRPPEWSLTAARAEAKTLRARIDLGADPAKEDQDRRSADDVNTLLDTLVRDHVSRKRESTRTEYQALIDAYLRPALGTMKVAEVEFVDVERLHRKISAHAPYRANRALAVLSKAFNTAIKLKLRVDNPAKFVERNQELPRERFLQPVELKRLHRVLDGHANQRVANLVRLLLLTGARLGETLSARWSAFDLRAGVWTKPSAHTKQKRDHRVPLSAEAVRLLKRMRGTGDALFADLNKDLVERHWQRIRKTAGLEDLRLHDLRHSFASFLAGGGESLPVIGGLLGHTQASTTHRYVHLLDDPLRKATDRVGAIVARRRS